MFKSQVRGSVVNVSSWCQTCSLVVEKALELNTLHDRGRSNKKSPANAKGNVQQRW